ncbi:hypothetical protein DEA8626_00329 [Defluviimonas aquaemixtae]|uniref:Glycosyltransferase RgtA/B/C/D-like domain-containing protein n=1 Tax=Albidovulum aquaemixtae TaxID=1542388 RepID=A0A2R8B2L4_9RHOB|nr:hypothetical protein [Defluviimonas aquaemixtae]SPH16815.1 hypothetical protein DEA8626_00329 [Defluviimonas aquaemixtae]
MAMAASNGGIVGQASVGRSVLWLALAVLACLSVLFVNGKPLFYFDTVGYVSQGHTALRQLGWRGESPLAGRREMLRETDGQAAQGSSPGTAEIEGEHTVDGSRSAFFALMSGALARLGALEGLVALNVVSVFVAVWLPMRVAARRWGLHVPVARAVALPIIVACLGSLPFFIAFLMPDTFAPVLLLVIATLTVFARHMRTWEILLALALGSLAIVSHLSHLAIAALMVPGSALISVILARRRWWVAPALVAVIVGLGFTEQSMLRSAAKAVSDSDVVIKPYITARLIQDGPGLAYLEKHCPDQAIPTCKLHTALQWSDDPYRITASHIVFETSERLGSFRLMDPADQKAVADDQIGFFFDVLADQPVATFLAFLKNTFIQSGWVSVEMTLPTDKIIAQNAGVSGLVMGEFEAGRITDDIGWLTVVTPMQEILYLLSLAAILVLVLLPRRVPGEVKALAVMVLLGILANALVCGGISQPATRYGARVIWLLPLTATILLIFARRARQFDIPAEGRG